MDRALHAERVGPDRAPRRHGTPWADLPDGTYVAVDDRPHLVRGDALVPWLPTAEGTGAPRARPRAGRALVLTPPSTVAVLRAGYDPVIR